MVKTLEKYSNGNYVYLHDCARCNKVDSARGNKSSVGRLCPECVYDVRTTNAIGRKNNLTHGLSNIGSKFYKLWINVKSRCYNVNDISYSNYGGRGIVMQENWVNNAESFIAYVSCLKNSNAKSYSIDRINNDKGYIEGNLKWSSKKEQANNRRIPLPRKLGMGSSGHYGISKSTERGRTVFKMSKTLLSPTTLRFKTIEDALNKRMEIYGY